MTPEARGWRDVRQGSSHKARVFTQAKECRGPPEARKGEETDSPIELLEGAGFADTNKTDFGFLASRTVEE